MIRLDGRIALVTGASRGIGRAVAVMLAEAGCDVAVNYRSDDSAARSVADEIEKRGRKALFARADISQKAEVDRMVAETIAAFGHIDILVNNAGVWVCNPITTMSVEKMTETIDINLYGTLYPTMAIVPHMVKRRAGVIINISSTAGQRGEAFHSPYAATKSAVIGLTKSWGTELAQHNIRVNCVAPGWVDTDMSRPVLDGDDASAVTDVIPLKRVGTPEEIAGACLFLASDLSTFVIGEVINVNGGAVLCG